MVQGSGAPEAALPSPNVFVFRWEALITCSAQRTLL